MAWRVRAMKRGRRGGWSGREAASVVAARCRNRRRSSATNRAPSAIGRRLVDAYDRSPDQALQRWGTARAPELGVARAVVQAAYRETSMPRRPRTHQLEELSERAFAAALPPAWVVRRMDPDYGIDRLVEIFGDDDRATGLQFHVQLKATDEPDIARARGALRFPRETADYYRSLRLPVLIVLYHAPTGKLFGRWFHAYNPHVATDPDRAAVAKSVRFQFEESDAWTDESPRLLKDGVRGFEIFSSPEFGLPLLLAANVSDEARRDELAPLVFALRRVFAPISDLVAVEQRAVAPDEPALMLGEGFTAVRLGDVASVTLDHPTIGLEDQWELAANIGVALSLVLTNVGQANIAAQIAAAVAPASSAIGDLGACWTISGALYRSRRIREAVELADALDSSDDARLQLASFAVLSVLVANRRELSEHDRERTLASANRRYERRIDRGDISGAAAEMYNQGMLYKRLLEPTPAIECFQLAGELDQTYLERAYFHQDLGGVLFESGRYAEAVDSYVRAVDLGADGIARALHADSLLWAGRYRDAQEQFEQYLIDTVSPEDAEWRLKLRVLRLLRQVAGDVQMRQPQPAAAAAELVDLENDHGMTFDEAWRLLDHAISLDACCAEAWFRRALLIILREDDPAPGILPALAAAVLHRENPPAWTNALITADPADVRLLRDVLYAGYRHARGDFADAVLEVVRAEHLWKHADRIIALLDEVAQEVEQADRDEGFKMRFNSPDGTVREVAISQAPPHRAPPLQALPSEKVGRNEPCPCGSGSKYKRCHGA